RRSPKEHARRGKPKVCIFCKDRVDWVDYKDVNLLRRFMSDRGKIRARRVTGNCAQHQRDVAIAIKTARELALLPYTQRTMSERGPGRGGRGGGGGGGGGRGRFDADADRPPREAPAAAVAADVDVVGAGLDQDDAEQASAAEDAG
ncbi:MAG: small subunit ribosomal protein, partial [Actinomycetota bacterium]|nr:small subunit ribosomal protein [Actinomycetota bacterium]